MAIIIKEIHVRTTIDSSLHKGKKDKTDLRQLKKELLQDVKQLVRQEIKRNSER